MLKVFIIPPIFFFCWFSLADFHGNYIFFLPVLGVLVIVALCVSMGYRKKIQLILSGKYDS